MLNKDFADIAKSLEKPAGTSGVPRRTRSLPIITVASHVRAFLCRVNFLRMIIESWKGDRYLASCL